MTRDVLEPDLAAIHAVVDRITGGPDGLGTLPGRWRKLGVRTDRERASIEVEFARDESDARFSVVVESPRGAAAAALVAPACRAWIRPSFKGDLREVAGPAIDAVLHRLKHAASDPSGLRAATDAAPTPWPEVRAPVERSEAPRASASASDVEMPNVQLIITHACQMRCVYCLFETDDPSRSMSADVLDRSLELVFRTDADRVAIHFGGAEPTLRWREIDRGVRRARELARTLGKGAELHLSTNGQTLDAERIAFLAEHAVVVRLSLDGTPETQAIGRPGKRDQDTYGRLPEVIAGLRAAGVYSEVTMVAHPAVVDRVAASFDHLVSLGVQEITISVASGVGWADHARKRLLVELGKIEAKYYRDTFVGASAWLQNARDADFVKRMYSREVAIDHAGDVHCGNAFLLSGPLGSDPLRLGHIDEGRTIDEWMARRPPLKDVLTNMYPAGLLRNNYLVHRAMGLWVRALRARFESEMCSIGDADAYDFEDVLGFDTGPEPHRALPVVR